MTTHIEDLTNAVVTILRAIPGIQQVPVDPPDTVSVSTFCLVFPLSGSVTNSPIGTKMSLHNIAVDIVTKRTDQARDMARIKPFIDLIATALLADPTFGATIQTYGNLTYDYFTDEYGGVPILGYRFQINAAKILA
jgi:hypothetical protein